MKILLSLLALCITPTVFAGPFDPPATDQSVNLLGIIFGSSVGSIPLGGAVNPVLASLMEKFNFIVLVVGMIVVSYVSIFSIINTAHEGTAMGQKWSAVWIPIRSVAGMALMVPAPLSGYSMIQVTVMWIIIQGIGAADSLWNIALDDLLSNPSAAIGSSIPDPSLKPAGNELAAQLLNAAICLETLKQASTSAENISANNGAGNWVSQNGGSVNFFVREQNPLSIQSVPPTNSYCSAGNKYASVSGTVFFGLDNTQDVSGQNVCGQLPIIASACTSDFVASSNPSDDDIGKAAQKAYDAKQEAIINMLNILSPIAQGIVQGNYTIPLNSSTGQSAQTDGTTNNISLPPSGFINDAAKEYVVRMASLVTSELDVASASAAQALTSSVNSGKLNGWITAGSFYFVFNKTLSTQMLKTVTAELINNPDANTQIPNCSSQNCIDRAAAGSGFSTNPTTLNNNNLSNNDLIAMTSYLAQGATYYVQDTSGGSGSSIFSASGPGASASAQAIGLATNANASILSSFSSLLNNNSGEPLINQANFGRSVMIAIEATFVALISLALVVGLGVLLVDTLEVLGTSITIPRIGSLMMTTSIIIMAITGFFLPVFALMWGFGATLAVYCPLIPYMIFTMAALGWLLTVVESIIAAPIVALGLILPGGDDLGRLDHALGILANVFLRPMLMIFGFLLAGRLYRAIIFLINMGMGSVFNTINVSSMFSALVVLAIYATFIVSVTNNCFSLIYAIPDKLLRWIGVGGEQTDVGAVAEAKQASQSASKEVGGGMSESGKLAGKKGSGMAAGAVNKSSNAGALQKKIASEGSKAQGNKEPGKEGE